MRLHPLELREILEMVAWSLAYSDRNDPNRLCRGDLTAAMRVSQRWYAVFGRLLWREHRIPWEITSQLTEGEGGPSDELVRRNSSSIRTLTIRRLTTPYSIDLYNLDFPQLEEIVWRDTTWDSLWAGKADSTMIQLLERFRSSKLRRLTWEGAALTQVALQRLSQFQSLEHLTLANAHLEQALEDPTALQRKNGATLTPLAELLLDCLPSLASVSLIRCTLSGPIESPRFVTSLTRLRLEVMHKNQLDLLSLPKLCPNLVMLQLRYHVYHGRAPFLQLCDDLKHHCLQLRHLCELDLKRSTWPSEEQLVHLIDSVRELATFSTQRFFKFKWTGDILNSLMIHHKTLQVIRAPQGDVGKMAKAAFRLEAQGQNERASNHSEAPHTVLTRILFSATRLRELELSSSTLQCFLSQYSPRQQVPWACEDELERLILHKGSREIGQAFSDALMLRDQAHCGQARQPSPDAVVTTSYKAEERKERPKELQPESPLSKTTRQAWGERQQDLMRRFANCKKLRSVRILANND